MLVVREVQLAYLAPRWHGASAGEEVVRAWCSAKPNSWSVQRANAPPVMCGTGKKHTPERLAGFTKTPSLTNTLLELERGSVAHRGMRQPRRGGGRREEEEEEEGRHGRRAAAA